MFKINDYCKRLEYIDNDGNVTIIRSFIDEDTLKDPTYNLYAYVEGIDDVLYLKFGKAVKETVYDRYDSTGHLANKRMIWVGRSEDGNDSPIHAKLRVRSTNKRGYTPADFDIINTCEAYRIDSLTGLENLISDITEYTNKIEVPKKYREDYEDVKKIVDEMFTSGSSYFLNDLCTRWGKTGTYSLFFKRAAIEQNTRIHILTSYVGTVKTSYSAEINTLLNNKDCKFIDPDLYDDNELLKVITKWLANPEHYIVYYLALTGDEDTCFGRRTKVLKHLQAFAKTMVIEEVDFGATCKKQIDKIKSFIKGSKNQVKYVIATTGTNTYKCADLFSALGVEPYKIKRDYLIDVLNKRPNAVGIDWAVLNNMNMVESFEYLSNEMENFTDMFTIENGRLKGENWFREVLSYLFNKFLFKSTRQTRMLKNHNLVNLDAATMIFTPANKEAQALFAKLIEEVLGSSYLVKVINGDETTNAEAEAEARQAIKDHGTKVIFIASGMANRSFSVPQIKNIILMCNSADPTQKVARGLTPWEEYLDMQCKVVDFRLSYENTALESYLSTIAVATIESNMSVKSIREVIKIITATSKLTFNEYFSNDVDPIRQISDDELFSALNSVTYNAVRAEKVLLHDINEVDFPNELFEDCNEELSAGDLMTSNIKGDANKKITSDKKAGNVSKKARELEKDPRVAYLAFMLNHKEVFNSYKYKKDILKNEFENNMPATRMANLQKELKMDMKVICQIAKLLIKNEIDILA